MERLISSSSSAILPSRSPLLKPQLLPPSSAAVSATTGRRSLTPPSCRLGFGPFRAFFPKEESPPRSSVPSRLLSLVPSEVKAGGTCATLQPTERRDLGGQVFQKVACTAALVLISALVVAIVQPVLASPAYATGPFSAKTGGSLLKSELLSSAWTGFFAGCLHTLSGPDHLAALAPLSIGRTRIESAAVGALWGCGHDAGQVIFGLLFLLLKDRLHIEVIRTWGTRVVGITLLAIGAMGIKEAYEVPTRCVALENGECDVSIMESLETAPSGKKKVGFATFATGIVHGLQPDALMMVLPALALPSRLAGAAFLCMFLVGTVIAMGSYTVLIGSCSQALKERVPRITEKLTWAASLLAISMGLGILVSQLFGFSLY